jgi:hypothetical protein
MSATKLSSAISEAAQTALLLNREDGSKEPQYRRA